MIQLGSTIKALRRKNGLSQEQLAAQLGLSRQAISKWEADLSQPDLDSVARLCEIFGVSSDELLGLAPQTAKPALPVQIKFSRLKSTTKALIFLILGAAALLLGYVLASFWEDEFWVCTLYVFSWSIRFLVPRFRMFWPFLLLAGASFAGSIYYYWVYCFRE